MAQGVKGAEFCGITLCHLRVFLIFVKSPRVRLKARKNMKKTAFFLLALLALASCGSGSKSHFISDSSYREAVEKAFNAKLSLIGKQFFALEDTQANARETEALKFLYAYMPVADATDYPTSFYLQNVRVSFQVQQEMPWGDDVPELLFRHFVLPLRVNNENLDSSRVVFYRQLKDRVKNLAMKDAILEVNHWCHERVTYQPSDGRTLSPLACVKTAKGRCGEESTFTVAALRAVGIPARQVYTPRWAHTDDNHAWVEAWADGKWYFLGACEPEPVLNLGWFNAPASRALLMHTRAFGDYRGPEEVMLRTSNYTEINLIDNYASTARTDFKVVDKQGDPVDSARVEFKIYNYGEFYTAVNKYTDRDGKTFLTAGKGDMLVWASKDGHYGYAKVSFGEDKELTITLNHDGKSDKAQLVLPMDSFNIVPPPEQAVLPEVTDAQVAANKARLAQEDSIRKAYEATFYKPSVGEKGSKNDQFLVKARGNWQVIKAFMDRHGDNPARVSALLGSLSDKDLADMPMEILEDSYNAPSDQLCPRVENEMIIQPFKQFFATVFSNDTVEMFRKDPSLLVAWTRANIRINPDPGALRIAQTPVGVWRSRLTDTRSRDIFFVDLARSLNIESRKDVVTSKVQFRKDGKWVDVDFEQAEQKVASMGTFRLAYTPTKLLDDPKYYSYFTISKIENGHASLLNFEEGQVDMGGGTSWSNTFKNGTPLDVGTYMLVTGTRLANGSVLATSRVFNVEAGKETVIDLQLRTSASEVQVIGSFDSESKFVCAGKEVSLLSQTGRGYYIIGIVGLGQEPTNHALRDIAKVKGDIDKWGRPMVLLFESERELSRFKAEEYGGLPVKTILGVDKDGSILRSIAAQMKFTSVRQLPVFVIADTFNRVAFCTQGYTIGLGEQLDKVLKKL